MCRSGRHRGSAWTIPTNPATPPTSTVTSQLLKGATKPMGHPCSGTSERQEVNWLRSFFSFGSNPEHYQLLDGSAQA